jgi:hypothetical protein
MEKNQGGRPPKTPGPVPAVSTLADLGEDQSRRWQHLADVPEKDFEAALTAVPPKPGLTAPDRRRIEAEKATFR